MFAPLFLPEFSDLIVLIRFVTEEDVSATKDIMISVRIFC